ncbi:unnamed protein product [Lepeophtheirus salmonis]|uniref:(salmon louse) hypothetical protein n=1 Tax=Lepeophtheirus salmonis TaxID=72036 RepID=A0A7R8CCQ8_LEPSM|nr:unnamed protein product [Lepeophtheirus salmonis]CAF2771858.1 unnamed protein product [Lepeophtheirus salmonis]
MNTSSNHVTSSSWAEDINVQSIFVSASPMSKKRRMAYKKVDLQKSKKGKALVEKYFFIERIRIHAGDSVASVFEFNSWLIRLNAINSLLIVTLLFLPHQLQTKFVSLRLLVYLSQSTLLNIEPSIACGPFRHSMCPTGEPCLISNYIYNSFMEALRYDFIKEIVIILYDWRSLMLIAGCLLIVLFTSICVTIKGHGVGYFPLLWGNLPAFSEHDCTYLFISCMAHDTYGNYYVNRELCQTHYHDCLHSLELNTVTNKYGSITVITPKEPISHISYDKYNKYYYVTHDRRHLSTYTIKDVACSSPPQDLNLSCKNNGRIIIKRTFYGRRDSSTCPLPNAGEFGQCSVTKPIKPILEKCRNAVECLIKISELQEFGQVCKNVVPYVETIYTCTNTLNPKVFPYKPYNYTMQAEHIIDNNLSTVYVTAFSTAPYIIFQHEKRLNFTGVKIYAMEMEKSDFVSCTRLNPKELRFNCPSDTAYEYNFIFGASRGLGLSYVKSKLSRSVVLPTISSTNIYHISDIVWK